MAKNLEQRLENRDPARATAPTLMDQIKMMENQFQLAMPRGAEATQLVRDSLTLLRQTRGLANCTPQSVLGGLMTCAQLGLRPGVLGHAWLIPFKNYKSGQMEAQLVIGYQGLIDLAYRSGSIQSISARTVYENDTFDVDYGLSDNLVHKPTIFGEKGKPIAYYAVVKLVGGGHAFYVMNHQEMCRYRDENAMAETREGRVVGPWADHFESMAHKTVLRQLSKWMPKATEFAQGINADSSVRVDLSPSAIDYPAHEDGEVVEPPVIDAEAEEGDAR